MKCRLRWRHVFYRNNPIYDILDVEDIDQKIKKCNIQNIDMAFEMLHLLYFWRMAQSQTIQF